MFLTIQRTNNEFLVFSKENTTIKKYNFVAKNTESFNSNIINELIMGSKIFNWYLKGLSYDELTINIEHGWLIFFFKIDCLFFKISFFRSSTSKNGPSGQFWRFLKTTLFFMEHLGY
jgi:hypothetical protein